MSTPRAHYPSTAFATAVDRTFATLRDMKWAPEDRDAGREFATPVEIGYRFGGMAVVVHYGEHPPCSAGFGTTPKHLTIETAQKTLRILQKLTDNKAVFLCMSSHEGDEGVLTTDARLKLDETQEDMLDRKIRAVFGVPAL